ncbi:DHA2 family efflux MFS transporter permease subunit [Lipingzhangella sp. LS1_29]|uniref:DHA2 family efflux MFS transporter permease subunit n=1 Tax=Lipingzhangella rawalii TaxID=2055835 RepID=A0ABU2H668_9ACTN|nr:DHA2 family efflux MFS transporter permease subunit [Lipingzhangella rawalii]MDS1270802.1 DHA2 family efflux MFS transporter permease subunit [Lipingzhangella rawalii]
MPESASGSLTSDEPVTQPKSGLLIGVLVVSAFVMILNETILGVALRDLSVELDVTTTTVQWLTSGFLLTMAVVIPITGFLLERYTPRQLFLAALTLFLLGTTVCALAPGFAVLLAGRVIQAGGTAVMIPLLMTSVMRLVPAERRGTTMGTITIVIAVAPAIGPTIGGGLLAVLGWRWMFVTVLPLALAALVIGLVWLHMDRVTRRVPLDVGSVLLSALGFGALLYGLSTIGESEGGEHLVPPWLPLVVGLAGIAVFVWRQLRLQRDDRALLDLRPFTRRRFVVGVILMALLFMCLLGAGAVLLPLFLQIVLGTNAFVAGLAMLPGGLLLGLMGRPVGRLYDRFGARPLVIPGAVALAASMWLFASLGSDSSVVAAIAIHLVLMAGLGFMMTPLMTDSLSALPDQLYSHGSAILTTLQQIAGALGIALFVSVSALGSVTYTGTPDDAGLRAAFMAAGVVGVLAVLTALTTRRRPASSAPAEDAPGREASGAAGAH